MRRPSVVARCIAVVALLAVVADACDTRLASAPTAPPATPTAAPPTPLSSAAQAAIYTAIEHDVEAIRGLTPKRPVDPVLLDEAGLRAELAAHADEDAPPAEVAREERILKALGALGPDADLAAITKSFLEGQVAGFYRPSDGHLYVVSRSGAVGAVERTTFAHEYTHALQDQHFSLLQQLGTPSAVTNGDRDLARLALIEGDATLVMSLWARQRLSPFDLLALLQSSFDPAQQAALDAMPPFLRDQALFPYEAGLQFAMNRQLAGGWPAVDDLYATPPESTEQVLHPAGDPTSLKPVPVTIPANLGSRLGAGWTKESEDTLGELQLRSWLAAGAPTGGAVATPSAGAATPTVAAAGWGGDRLAYYVGPDGGWTLVLRTAWDTPRDAVEFASVATAAVTAGGRHGAVQDGGSPRERWVVLASSAELVPAAVGAVRAP